MGTRGPRQRGGVSGWPLTGNTAVWPDRSVSYKEGWPHHMIDIMMPKIETIGGSEEEYQGRYQIEPLERGFGQTVGNAMRRVLLSSLPGAAVTSIKIDNVYHEFSAIEDVKEDITELILNVKQIRLKSFSDRPIQCRLEASGGGLVTAADIICPPEIEVFNPELQLATLDGPESRLSLELTVERGRGYVPADHREGLPIGVIPVDAIYTPVRRVNFTVEPTRVGGATDYERLVIDVMTDGTIAPTEAVSEAAKILIRHFELLRDLLASQQPGAGEADRPQWPHPGKDRRPADRGPRPDRPRLQLPEARGHHQGRPGARDDRGRPPRRQELRSEVARGATRATRDPRPPQALSPRRADARRFRPSRTRKRPATSWTRKKTRSRRSPSRGSPSSRPWSRKRPSPRRSRPRRPTEEPVAAEPAFEEYSFATEYLRGRGRVR